jgi:hypothetical protein
MDQIVAQALTVYSKIKGEKRALAMVAGAGSYQRNGNGNGNGNGSGHHIPPKELVLTAR